MKEIEKISAEWSKDSIIDENSIATEAARIPILHNKYYMMYIETGLKLKTIKAQLTTLQKNKFEYYSGTMSIEKLQELGWKPYQLKHLKSDVARIIEQDQDVINMILKIGYWETVVKFLEDIIKNINNRNFILKSIIDWNRFTTGSL